MLIRVNSRACVQPSEITPESVWRERRRFMTRAGLAIGSVALAGLPHARAGDCRLPNPIRLRDGEQPNTLQEIAGYNNFYEFSPDKKAVAHLARDVTPQPWKLTVEGEVAKPLSFELDDVLRLHPVESRIYRLRCVEGWSMVIPWDGIPLCSLVSRAQPTSRAKYVRFVGPHDPKVYIGQRRSSLQWPYTEALTIAEAMHPLSFLVTGLYGKPLPIQNGAPLRLAVPWKYGFKSIKAIAQIRFEEQRPQTSWTLASPSEYGFYGNVNPDVPHPRWTQARETRIGELKARPTLPFNGYADEVAQLYAGLDLRANY